MDDSAPAPAPAPERDPAPAPAPERAATPAREAAPSAGAPAAAAERTLRRAWRRHAGDRELSAAVVRAGRRRPGSLQLDSLWLPASDGTALWITDLAAEDGVGPDRPGSHGTGATPG